MATTNEIRVFESEKNLLIRELSITGYAVYKTLRKIMFLSRQCEHTDDEAVAQVGDGAPTKMKGGVTSEIRKMTMIKREVDPLLLKYQVVTKREANKIKQKASEAIKTMKVAEKPQEDWAIAQGPEFKFKPGLPKVPKLPIVPPDPDTIINRDDSFNFENSINDDVATAQAPNGYREGIIKAYPEHEHLLRKAFSDGGYSELTLEEQKLVLQISSDYDHYLPVSVEPLNKPKPGYLDSMFNYFAPKISEELEIASSAGAKMDEAMDRAEGILADSINDLGAKADGFAEKLDKTAEKTTKTVTDVAKEFISKIDDITSDMKRTLLDDIVHLITCIMTLATSSNFREAFKILAVGVSGFGISRLGSLLGNIRSHLQRVSDQLSSAHAQAPTSDNGLFSALYMLCVGLFTNKKPSEDDSIMANLYFANQSLSFVKNTTQLVELCFRYLIQIFRWIKYWIYGDVDEATGLEALELLRKAHKHTSAAKHASERVGGMSEFIAETEKAMTCLNRYRRFFYGRIKDRNLDRQFVLLAINSHMWRQTLLELKRIKHTRVRPTIVIFSGDPGSGKSNLLPIFCAAVWKRMGHKDFTEDLIYVADNGDFNEGYDGQPFWAIDEFNQGRINEECTSNLVELIKMGNNFPYVLNMAKLEKKGNVRFDSPFIPITVNSTDLGHDASLTRMGAINRRVDAMYHVVRDRTTNKYTFYRRRRGRQHDNEDSDWNTIDEKDPISFEQIVAETVNRYKVYVNEVLSINRQVNDAFDTIEVDPDFIDGPFATLDPSEKLRAARNDIENIEKEMVESIIWPSDDDEPKANIGFAAAFGLGWSGFIAMQCINTIAARWWATYMMEYADLFRNRLNIDLASIDGILGLYNWHIKNMTLSWSSLCNVIVNDPMVQIATVILSILMVVALVRSWIPEKEPESQGVYDRNTPGFRRHGVHKIRPKVSSGVSEPHLKGNANLIDKGTDDTITTITSNLGLVSLHHSGRSHGPLHCTDLGNRLIIFPMHLVQHAQPYISDSDLGSLVFRFQFLDGTRDFRYDELEVIHDSEADVMVVQLPRKSGGQSVNERRTIVHHFVKEDDLEKDISSCTYVGLRNKPNVHLHQIDVEGVHVVTELNAREYTMKYGDDTAVLHIPVALVGKGDTRPGDCGMLLVCRNTAITSKILGYHVAYHSRTTSCRAMPLTQEYISELISQFVSVANVGHIDHIGPAATNIRLLDKSERVFVSTTTVIRDGPLKDEYHAPTKAPAILRHFVDNDGNKRSPMFEGIRRATGPRNGLIRDGYVDQAIEAVVDTMPSNVDFEPLSDFENINGVPGNDYISGMNLKTSIGYPEMINVHNGKRYFVDGVQPNANLNARGYASINRFINDVMINGERPAIFVAACKDELLPLEKTQFDSKQKTRIVWTAEFGYIFLIRKFCARPFSSMMRDQHRFWSSVGINPHSALDWTHLARRLCMNQKGWNYMALDFKNYDGTIPAELLEWAIEAITLWFKRMKAPKEVVENWELLAESLVCARCIAIDVVYDIIGANRSGHGLTALFNTIMTRLVLLYSAIRLSAENLGYVMPVFDIDRHIKMAIYGDDSVCAVHPLCYWFNQKSVSELTYEVFGLTLVDADKAGNEMREYIPQEEVTFLKRRFVQYGLYYLAPLPINTIRDALCYINKNMNPYDGTMASVQSALPEFFYHGREVFEAEKAKLNDLFGCWGWDKISHTFAALSSKWMSVPLIDHAKAQSLSKLIEDTPEDSEFALHEIHIYDARRIYDSDVDRLRYRVGLRGYKQHYKCDVKDHLLSLVRDRDAIAYHAPYFNETPIRTSAEAQVGEDGEVPSSVSQPAEIIEAGMTTIYSNAVTYDEGEYWLPTSIAPPDPYYTEWDQSMVTRLYEINTFQFSTSDTVGARKFISTQPDDLFAKGKIQDSISQYAYMSADVEYIIEIQSSFQHTGSFQVAWMSDAVHTDPFFYDPPYSTSCGNSNIVDLSASSTHHCVLRYCAGRPMFSLGSSYYTGAIGSICIFVVSPLQNTSGTPSTYVNVSVKARFINVKLAGPAIADYALAVAQVGDEAGPSTADQKVEEVKQTKFSDIAFQVGSAAEGFTAIPFVGGVAAVVSTVAKIAGGIARLFGKGKNIADTEPQTVFTGIPINMSTGFGAVAGHKMTFDPTSHTTSYAGDGGDERDNMIFMNLFDKEILINVGSFATSLAVNSQITRWNVGAQYCHSVSTGVYCGHPLAVMANYANKQSGTLIYKIIFRSSTTQNFRVRIVHHMRGDTIPSTLTVGDGDVFSEIFQVQGSVPIERKIPLIGRTNRILVGPNADFNTADSYSAGTVAMYLDGAVTTATSTAALIYYEIYVRAAPDFILSEYMNTNATITRAQAPSFVANRYNKGLPPRLRKVASEWVDATAQMAVDDTENDDNGPIGITNMRPQGIVSKVYSGEEVFSLRELLHRFQLVGRQITSTSTVAFGYVFVIQEPLTDAIKALSSMYRYYRGDFMYMMEFYLRDSSSQYKKVRGTVQIEWVNGTAVASSLSANSSTGGLQPLSVQDIGESRYVFCSLPYDSQYTKMSFLSSANTYVNTANDSGYIQVTVYPEYEAGQTITVTALYMTLWHAIGDSFSFYNTTYPGRLSGGTRTSGTGADLL